MWEGWVWYLMLLVTRMLYCLWPQKVLTTATFKTIKLVRIWFISFWFLWNLGICLLIKTDMVRYVMLTKVSKLRLLQPLAGVSRVFSKFLCLWWVGKTSELLLSAKLQVLGSSSAPGLLQLCCKMFWTMAQTVGNDGQVICLHWLFRPCMVS